MGGKRDKKASRRGPMVTTECLLQANSNSASAPAPARAPNFAGILPLACYVAPPVQEKMKSR